MRRNSNPGKFESFRDFMDVVGGLRVDDIRDGHMKVKVFEDNSGYLMMYSFEQAKRFALEYGLKIGTLSICEKELERDGDSHSKHMLQYSYRTRDYGTNTKKFFFYRNNVDASYDELD